MGIRSLVVAVTAAAGLVVLGPLSGLTASAPVAADTPALTVVGDARYAVDPAAHRVRVVVGLSIHNARSETITKRFWFDRAYLAIQPGASSIRVTGSGLHPTARVTRSTSDHRMVEIGFGRKLYSGQSLALALRFDIRDPGGSLGRPIRIGPGLVSFPVWAFASDSTGGARASVTIPAGLDLQHGGDAFGDRDQQADGSTELRTPALGNAAAWRSYVVATGEAAFATTSVEAAAGEATLPIRIRGWVDDPAWRARTSALVGKVVPGLAADTGLPGPAAGLVIEEATQWALDGGAVVWDPSIGRLLVANDARDRAIVRGIAEAFVTPDVVGERWAIEGFGELYAERIAAAAKVQLPPLAFAPAQAVAAGPLNGWSGPGVATAEVDAAARATSTEVARRIVTQVGDAGTRAAFARLSGTVSAYQPIGEAPDPSAALEPADGPVDWRRILDAFQAEAPTAEAAAAIEDIWRSYVVRPDEAPLLEERAGARERYLITANRAGWLLPVAVRTALTNWRFETVDALLDQIDALMSSRAELDIAAAAAGLEPPASVEPLIEGGDITAAATAVRRMRSALVALEGAREASAVSGPLATIGLIGETPLDELTAARTAFEDGRPDDTVKAAATAQAAWLGAEDLGRSRLTMLGLILGTIGALLFVVRLHRVGPIVQRRADGTARR